LYKQVRHPSKENVECYKDQGPHSTSQESSTGIPKHHDFKYAWPPRKSGTLSATVHSNSEDELGTEGHHQDMTINLILSQPLEARNLNITARSWMGRECIKLHFKSQEDRGEHMHPQGTSDAGIVADEPSPNENVTPEVVTPSSMSRAGIPRKNDLQNNSA
jgi:hypothetical protein